MRRISLLLLLAMPLSAQEVYQQSATAQQVTDLTVVVSAFNQKRCADAGVAIGSCTQANVCVALSAPGGAGCTNAQARNNTPPARIYGNSQAEREDYVLREMVQPEFVARRNAAYRSLPQVQCSWWNAQNQATKDARLAEIGLPSGIADCPYK